MVEFFSWRFYLEFLPGGPGKKGIYTVQRVTFSHAGMTLHRATSQQQSCSQMRPGFRKQGGMHFFAVRGTWGLGQVRSVCSKVGLSSRIFSVDRLGD